LAQDPTNSPVDALQYRREPNRNIMKLYICYEDKGPSGPCGQDMRTTSHQNRLYIVEGTYDEIKQKLETLESSFPKNGRRSPKLTNYYMEGNNEEMYECGFWNDEIVYL